MILPLDFSQPQSKRLLFFAYQKQLFNFTGGPLGDNDYPEEWGGLTPAKTKILQKKFEDEQAEREEEERKLTEEQYPAGSLSADVIETVLNTVKEWEEVEGKRFISVEHGGNIDSKKLIEYDFSFVLLMK